MRIESLLDAYTTLKAAAGHLKKAGFLKESIDCHAAAYGIKLDLVSEGIQIELEGKK